MGNEEDLKKLQVKEEKIKIEQQETKFYHRRMIAYICLFSVLIFTGALFYLVPVEKIEPLGSVISIFYFAMMSIVGAYYGLASFDDYQRFKN